MIQLPPDPIEARTRELVRSVTQFQRIIADALKSIENSGGIGDPFTFAALTKAQTECRETLMEIHKIRLAKAKQLREDRVAAAKLPPIDETVIREEVNRLLHERLSEMTAAELRQLADERAREDRLLAEAVEAPGHGVRAGDE